MYATIGALFLGHVFLSEILSASREKVLRLTKDHFRLISRVWELAPGDAENQSPRLYAHVGGTLLGAAFDPEGGLYLADATRGLLFLDANESTPSIGRARIVASIAPSDPRLALSEEHLSTAEIRYANDVAVDAATGNVYFTDATRIAPIVLTDRVGQVRRRVNFPVLETKRSVHVEVPSEVSDQWPSGLLSWLFLCFGTM